MIEEIYQSQNRKFGSAKHQDVNIGGEIMLLDLDTRGSPVRIFYP